MRFLQDKNVGAYAYVTFPIFSEYFHDHSRVLRVHAHLGGVGSEFCFLESCAQGSV